MSRLKPLLLSLGFLFLAPGTVAGLVPYALSHWRAEPPFYDLTAFVALGWLFIIFGALILLESFVRFALQGNGTPAPPFPTEHLVVSGFYAHVRNPMYVAVLALIFGQALIFASLALVAYGALIFLAFHIFILNYEEPTLRRTHGHSYDIYVANVPRWIPRFTPWTNS